MGKNIDSKKVVSLYEEGKTMSEISSLLGDCSYSTINRILHKNGVSIRSKGDSPENNYRKNPNLKQDIENVDRLSELYERNVPVNDIAKELNISPKAVRRKAAEIGLKRTKSMMARDFYNPANDALMIQMYENGKSTTEIAKEIGITHRSVQNHLKHCGVKLRTNSESHFTKNNKDFPKELTDFETVYDIYVSRRTSKSDMAKMLGVSPNVVDRVLREFGIRKRDSSESKIGISAGAKHPNWKGGRITLYKRLREYFSTNQVRKVLKRDGNKCQICGDTHKLQVHHIKPFKEIFEEILAEHKDLDVQKNKEELYKIMVNDKRMNDLDNLITYCKICHYKVHGYKMK